jgi:nucleoside-diphosphate-sugar epimerase
MRVLLTGCTGKVGSVLGRRLVERGHKVLGVDRRPDRAAPFRVAVDDLRDPLAMHRMLDRAERDLAAPVDAIVHLAGHTNIHAAAPDLVLRDNLAIAASAFKVAMSYGVPRLVFASSVQAFLGGMDLPPETPEEELPRPQRLPIDESHPAAPTNPYGLSKLLTEQMLAGLCAPGFGSSTGTRPSAVSLRLPYVMNERAFAWSARPGHRPDYRWSGPEAYAYIHVDDAAAAMAAAVEAPIEGHEMIWACATDPRHVDSVDELVERYYRDVPGAAEAVARESFHDVSKAERLLGWRPERSLREARDTAAASTAG